MVSFKCLLHIGNLWGANGKSLDVGGCEGTEVTNSFNISGSHKLSKATGPAEIEHKKCDS